MYFDEDIIQKLFQAQINTLGSEGLPMEVAVNEGATELLKFNVIQNKTNITTSIIGLSAAIKNATIIETPIIVNFLNDLLR